MAGSKHGGGNHKTPQARQLAAERARRVLELRLKGAQFEDIGRQLGISTQAAFKHYKRELRRIPEPVAAEVRKAMLERMDRLLLEAFGLLADPKNRNRDETIRTILKIQERVARILGTDAPTKVDMTNHEDPEAVARRERQLEMLDKLAPEQQRELLRLIREAGTEGKPTDGGQQPAGELAK
jgi:hypothetical protein